VLMSGLKLVEGRLRPFWFCSICPL
jgi:hypothetical protein